MLNKTDHTATVRPRTCRTKWRPRFAKLSKCSRCERSLNFELFSCIPSCSGSCGTRGALHVYSRYVSSVQNDAPSASDRNHAITFVTYTRYGNAQSHIPCYFRTSCAVSAFPPYCDSDVRPEIPATVLLPM